MFAALLLAATAPLPIQVLAADTTPAAARAVVQRYYDAIDRGRYAAAWRMWADGGRASRQTLAGFTKGFARTRRTSVIAGDPGRTEGAAGSVYVTVPVRVQAMLKDGTRQRFVGSYVLRRVNGVDGATAEQLRWHIASASLRAVR